MGSESSTDEYDYYPACGYYYRHKKIQYNRRLRKVSEHILKRDEINAFNFICGYFRILEHETNCRIVDGIRQIIVTYCSFDMNINICIWDTMGQERFHHLAPIYYRDSDAVILVYDITDDSSFSMLKYWLDELRKIRGDDIVIVIACNKIDLKRKIKVAHCNAEKLAADINAQIIQVSAKTDTGIDELFYTVGLNMLNNTTVNNNGSFKIIMLGQGRVGKTSIVGRYIYDTFSTMGGNTIESHILKKDIIVACSLKRYIRSITFDHDKEMLNLLQQEKQQKQKQIQGNSTNVSVMNPMSIGNYVYNQYQDLKKEWFGWKIED